MFLIDLGSLGSPAEQRRVDVVLPSPVSVGTLPWPQAQGKQPLRKNLKDMVFLPAGKQISQNAEKAILPQVKRGSQQSVFSSLYLEGMG